MTVYEGMFILDSTKYSRDPDTVTGQLNDLVTEHGERFLCLNSGTKENSLIRSMVSVRALIGSFISA